MRAAEDHHVQLAAVRGRHEPAVEVSPWTGEPGTAGNYIPGDFMMLRNDPGVPNANRYSMIQLNGDPLSTHVKTKPASGKKVDFSSNTTKSYRAQLSALRNDFKQWLKANAPDAKVTGEFDISLNAVAVQLNGAQLGTIASAPMSAPVSSSIWRRRRATWVST